MQLNTIKPAAGAKHAKKRVGRGIGSGLGKTAGLGHKGQKARAGGFHKIGFEGGQMPLQRRLPKRGFISMSRDDTAEVRLSDIDRLKADTVDILTLKEAGIVPIHALSAKVIVAGEIKRKVTLHGLLVSKGAKAAVEAAGGTVEIPAVAPVPAGKSVAKAAARAKARAEAIAKAETEIKAKSKPKAEPKAGAKAEPKAAAKAEGKTDGKTKPAGKKTKKAE